jgi:nicotinate-nucleotide adenylyltransferase
MKLAIFGGTFNPVHFGHLLLAEYCRELCQLDHVWFMPAATAPHKQQLQTASDAQRVDMLRLAIAGHPQFAVSEMEVERGGVSYTIDTLHAVRSAHPAAELFFLMGADSLDDFHNWREPDRICQIATPIVVDRFGSDPVDLKKFSPFASPEQLQKIKQLRIEMPRIELSSSEIRNRAAAGQSIRYQLPRAVEKFIETNRLYT